MHDPKEAVKHIQKKYDYFRDKIDSAEKFIELAATQSTMSKKKYTIRCPDKPDIESWFWLQTELARHRAAIAE